MELDQQSHLPVDPLPPPPPPKVDPQFPILPENSKNSGRSSPLRQADDTRPRSPPPDKLSGESLMPPSPNPVSESFNLAPPENSFNKTKQSKKSNPLSDLVDSEREYIDLLAGIIRKVAGAWSRTNFPPKQLDTMFRGIESIYKANRGLLTGLKEIGPSPASPKALGDLLMRWINDLDAPYAKYCTNYATGFDAWQPIVANTRLMSILAALSSVHPPSPTLLPTSTDPHANDSPTWTLDALFALPRGRLKYYKKLYTRLLKNTQPGRSDHKLLTGAVERLEVLLGILAEREKLVVGQEVAGQTISTPLTVESGTSPDTKVSEWVDSVQSNSNEYETTDLQVRVGATTDDTIPQNSDSSETRAVVESVSSQGSQRTPSSTTLSMPISDLERRLSTERVLDIFTLKPRSVRLQMNPSTLPFTRSILASTNVEVHFTPRVAPDSPHIHLNGHLFLLTDLCLVCERMTTEERQVANSEVDGQDLDMWLLYPPLAGKHLRVLEVPSQTNMFQIQVLKKETLVFQVQSQSERDKLIKGFKECIEAANLLSPRAGQPAPPPVPQIKTLPQSSSALLPQMSEQRASSRTDGSSTSPMTTSKSSPQVWDHNRFPGDGEPPRQALVPSPTEGHSPSLVPDTNSVSPHSSMESMTNKGYSGRLPIQSVSQPQLHNPTPFESSNPSQQTMSSAASTPYLPPAREASNFWYRQPEYAMRPATAPGQPQYRAPPVQVHPPQIQKPGSTQPYPSFGQFSTTSQHQSDFLSEMALRKSSSTLSLGSIQQRPNGFTPSLPGPLGRSEQTQSMGGFPSRSNPSPQPFVHQPHPRLPFPPSATFTQRTASFATTSSWAPSTREPSPPNSPINDDPAPSGPVISTITAQFKCKVFLQLHHGQWKSLGSAKLKLYLQQPTNVKQLVVEAESKDKAILISTIVLTDGVERVGRTGVAIELSDKGTRTGIIYMIQLRNETSASGLFDSLLAGSDRAAGRSGKA